MTRRGGSSFVRSAVPVVSPDLSALFKKEAEERTAVHGVRAPVIKTHPFRMKLNAPYRQGFMLQRLNDPVRRVKDGMQALSRPVHTLVMGAVDGKAGPADPCDP